MVERKTPGFFEEDASMHGEEEGFDEFADNDLGGRVREAYDSVMLPGTSFATMLSSLVAQAAAVSDWVDASDRTDAEMSPSKAGIANASIEIPDEDRGDAVCVRGGVEPKCAAKRKPRISRIALSAAACLVVAAVAGVIAFTAPSNTVEPTNAIVLDAASEDATDRTAEKEHESAENADAVPPESTALSGETGDSSSDVSSDGSTESGATSFGNAQGSYVEEGLVIVETQQVVPREAVPDGGASSGSTSANDAGNVATDYTTDAARGLAYQHPTVKTASAGELRVVTDANGNPQEVDTTAIVQVFEDATAYTGSVHEPVDCVVYTTVDGSYAATFEGDAAYYLLQ